LVFNPEVLHGTQVNISDETRVALTTRLNPRTPRFAPAAPFHFEHWLSSVDLQKKKKVHSLTVFPSSQFQGQPSITKREPLEDTRTVHLKRPMTLPSQGEIAICPAALLREGEKLAVDLNNARVIIKKEAGQLRAYTRVCPHLGVDLVDGYHDEQEVYCPGHGISFRWSDGESHCKSFRLKAFIARENDGQIFLSRKATIAGAADSVPEADESQGGTPEKASA